MSEECQASISVNLYRPCGSVYRRTSLYLCKDTQDIVLNLSNDIGGNFLLMHNGNILETNRTVREQGIETGDDLIVVYCVDKRKPVELDRFSLQILFIKNGILKMLIIPSTPNADVSDIRKMVIKYLNLKRGGFEFVFENIVLRDGETLKGIGYQQGQNISLHLLNNEKLVTNELLKRITDESSPNHHAHAHRIMMNLNLENLSGHPNEKASEECKRMIQVVKDSWVPIFSELTKVESKTDVDTLNILDSLNVPNLRHAIDYLNEISELCQILKLETKKGNELRQKHQKRMENLYRNQVKKIQKLSCGKHANEANFFNYLSPSYNYNYHLIILGPPRDGKLRLNLPRIYLRTITSATTIQDLINSYKVYAEADLTEIKISLTYNSETLHPECLLVNVLKDIDDVIYINVVKKKNKKKKINSRALPEKEMEAKSEASRGFEEKKNFKLQKPSVDQIEKHVPKRISFDSAIEKSKLSVSTFTEERLLNLLKNSIKDKKKDLECPVCLEVAEVPIYSCQESHLICNSCMPKLTCCPVCRQSFKGKGVSKRHRYAEKSAAELKTLQEELGNLDMN